MAVFITRNQFDLCWDYCMLISECLELEDRVLGCWGWTHDNYADNVCLWKCLSANEWIVKNDLWSICRSPLLAYSETAREICKQLKEQKVITGE